MNVINTQHKKRSIAVAVTAVMLSPCAQAADVNISGFLSVGGGFVDDESSISYGGYDSEDLTFNRNLLGLQVSGQVNEKLTATAQMVARSEDEHEFVAEWAYVNWQVSDSSNLRVGRLRTPFYMYSDFVDVGYSYAWISPPQEVYYIPFNNVNGIDYYVTSALGSFDTSLQVYFGTIDEDLDVGELIAASQTHNQVGIAGTIGRDWWTLRAAYHQAELTIDFSDLPIAEGASFGQLIALLGDSPYVTNVLVDRDNATFAEIGLSIDTGRFVAAAEYVEFDVADSFLAKNNRYYTMVGVRAGSLLFHVTGAKSDDEPARPAAGIPVTPENAQIIGTLHAFAAGGEIRETISVGTRWDVRSGVALKLQMDNVDDESGEQNVYSVALQTVF